MGELLAKQKRGLVVGIAIGIAAMVVLLIVARGGNSGGGGDGGDSDSIYDPICVQRVMDEHATDPVGVENGRTILLRDLDKHDPKYLSVLHEAQARCIAP